MEDLKKLVEKRDYDPEILVELAKMGGFMPLEFVIAARQCDGYDVAKAQGIENQYFDSDGLPITDEEYEAHRDQ